MEKGLAGYYLPRFRSFFAMVEPGDMFGHVDFRQNACDQAGSDSENQDDDYKSDSSGSALSKSNYK